MNPEKLRQQFKSETGEDWINPQGEPDLDYVMWLEGRLIPAPEHGEKTPEEILRKYFDKYREEERLGLKDKTVSVIDAMHEYGNQCRWDGRQFAQWLGLNGYSHYADVQWHKEGEYPSLKSINQLYNEWLNSKPEGK